MHLKKNTTLGKAKKVTFILFIFKLLSLNAYSDSAKINEKYAELNILDKVSSKTSSVKIKIGKELILTKLVQRPQVSKLK